MWIETLINESGKETKASTISYRFIYVISTLGCLMLRDLNHIT